MATKKTKAKAKGKKRTRRRVLLHTPKDKTPQQIAQENVANMMQAVSEKDFSIGTGTWKGELPEKLPTQQIMKATLEIARSRPKLELDQPSFEYLGFLGYSIQLAAKVQRITHQTLLERKEWYEAWLRGKTARIDLIQHGKVSHLLAQNPKMLIHLDKTELGATEKVDLTVAPRAPEVEVTDEELLKELQEHNNTIQPDE